MLEVTAGSGQDLREMQSNRDKMPRTRITNCGEIRVVSHRSKLVSGTRWFQSSSGDNASYFTLSTIADGKKKKFGMWSENAGEERRGEGEEGRGGEGPCSTLLLQDKSPP